MLHASRYYLQEKPKQTKFAVKREGTGLCVQVCGGDSITLCGLFSSSPSGQPLLS